MLVLGPGSSNSAVTSTSSPPATIGPVATMPVAMSSSRSTTPSQSSSSSPPSTRRVTKPQMQRNRSKGTIVAYGSNNNGSDASVTSHGSASNNSTSNNNNNNSQSGAATTTSTTDSSSSLLSQALALEHSSLAARLVLVCAQHVVAMGARTQLLLCPPGPQRLRLQQKLRQLPRTLTTNYSNNNNQSQSNTSLGRRNSADSMMLNASQFYYSLDQLVRREILADYAAQEEAMLLSTLEHDDDSDEEASSGDDDDDDNAVVPFQSNEAIDLDDPVQYREALYGPTSLLSSEHSSSSVYHHSRGGGASSSKLPFSRRKLRLLDCAGPHELSLARAYLKRQYRRSQLRAINSRTRAIRQVQLDAKRRRQEEVGDVTTSAAAPSLLALDSAKTAMEPFDGNMTPATAVALLLESLLINPRESLEGMAKCYDGIVAVGVALLDLQASLLDPTTSSSDQRPLRSEIMAALAPLLITSLEQASGDAILQLAKIRRMAGTMRYQRRFVQRIAPLLIRPPQGALYCVKHQQDMEAILAACELILDSAFDVFGKGWYERGRLLLVDKKRAKTLQSAAQQLRDLVTITNTYANNNDPSSGNGHDGLALGLTGRRRLLLSAATGRKGEDSVLAEWEVIAVDRQIRLSIASVMTMDWSKTIIHSDIPKPHNRRATVASGSKRVPHSATLDSPKTITSSPRSPPRSTLASVTTPSLPSLTITPEAVEGNWSPRSSAQRPGRSLSPPSIRLPQSPPPLQRASSHDDSKTPMTPPRSPVVTPKSPTRSTSADNTASTPLSPKRTKSAPIMPFPAPPSSMPNSPSASSVGSEARTSAAINPYASPVPTHNRTLTSSIAERKRTVAACRALRAQIQRFEEAFIQLHGRPPKGASERAPLATTYAQYKEWKRAIRTDAACRVQALFRGALTRWKLLRMKDPRMTRVVLKRAGRFKQEDSSIISQISLPVEIGQPDPSRSLSAHRQMPATDPNTPPGQNLPWASKIVRRRNPGDRGDALPTTGAAPRPFPPPSSSPTQEMAPLSSSTSYGSTFDFEGMDLSQLQARKRDLKQQLKQYDMNFARKHARMPVKAEKEPIRHLYEEYNSLKSRITSMETEGRHPRELAHVAPLSPLQLSPSAPAPYPQQRVSPTSGSESSANDEPAATHSRSVPSPTPRSRRKLPVAGSPPMAARSQPSTAPAAQDLSSLKAEKSQLHQMLRSYEKDFFREHNRQVSSYTDIQPVANQYRRYKDIKKAIAVLQGQAESG